MQLIQVTSPDEKLQSGEKFKKGKVEKMKNEWTMERLERSVSGWNKDKFETKGTGSYGIDHKGDKYGKFDINYSDILTKLIQEAGRFCERYASDLFISWENIVEKLKDYDFCQTSGGKFLFGFRESGVDHKEWVLNQLNTYEYGRYYYRSLWMLDVEISNQYVGFAADSYEAEIKLTLRKISL